MNTKSAHTYDRVFQHPTCKDLEWHEVRKMFEAIGEVKDEHNGNMRVTMSGQSVVFQTPRDTKAATEEEVHQIRHFIRGAEQIKSSVSGHHLLLVIDHQSATIYQTEFVGSEPERITPLDPDGHKGHVHSAHDFPGTSELPTPSAYFEAITGSLGDSDPILIFGSGTGSSSEMDTYVMWLKTHHPKVDERVFRAQKIDQSHLTEGELLAKARDIYAKSPVG